MISAATTVYYLMINNVPALKNMFPQFSGFLLTMGVFIFLGFGLLGYGSMKRGPLKFLYEAETAIPAESNPYTYKYRPGREKLLYSYNPIIETIRLNSWISMSRFFEEKGLPPVITEDQVKDLQVYIGYLTHLSEGGDIRNY